MLQELFTNFFEKTVQPRELSDSDSHLMTLFSLVLQIKAKKVLELGVRWGDTTEPLLLGCKINEGHLTSVDIDTTEWICPDDLKEFYTFEQSDSIEFLKKKVDEEEVYDLIYIDDWHEYKHVKKELELIDKLTTKNSIVLLHDLMAFYHNEYHLPMESPEDTEWGQGGPTRAVFELDKDKFEYVTIPVSNGLTILRKKYN